MRIHAECANHILKLLCAVDNLAFVEFIRQRGKNLSRKFDTNADINAIGTSFNIEALADSFQPLASAASNRKNTVFTGINMVAYMDLIAARNFNNFSNSGVKIEIDTVFQLLV